jgi:nucleotidyltransferase substrate binding protein (TIGR01987 family)
MEIDVRWMQRFQNFQKALFQLEQAVLLGESRELSNLEKQGTIQAFEFTHELAWKTLKDFLQTRGNIEIYGSRDATREAFKNGLIQDGETWMEMIESRNLSSHTYNESVANEIVDKIASSYVTRFAELRTQLERLAENGD